MLTPHAVGELLVVVAFLDCESGGSFTAGTDCSTAFLSLPTDTAADSYQIAVANLAVFGPPLANNDQRILFDVGEYYTTSQNTLATTFSTHASVIAGLTAISAIAVYDVSGVSVSISGSGVGSCQTLAGCTFTTSKNPVMQVAGYNFGAPAVTIPAILGPSGVNNVFCSGGFTDNCTHLNANTYSFSADVTGPNGAGTTSPISQVFIGSCNATPCGPLAWDVISASWGQSAASLSTTTSTVTATTSTTSIGGGTISSSATELIKRHLYFDQGQNNVNLVATVGNETGGLYAKISRVDINTTTGTIYLAVYAVSASGQVPSASNPLVQIFNKPFTVTNGSTNVALSIRPPISTQVNPYSYYAVAIFPTTSKGNTITLSSSGIVMFQATGQSGSWNDFVVPTNTIPTNFYTGSVTAFTPFAYADLSYSVAIVTSTSTVGTITSTVVVTSTSTEVINAANPATANFWLVPAMFIMTFFGLFTFIGILLKRTRFA